MSPPEPLHDSGPTARRESSDVRAGELLAARYRVEHVLGAGGMGIVVAARDETNGRKVAVKLLRAGIGDDGIQRFLREARTASLLTSAHIVEVYELGALDEQRPYMVMERLNGRDLGQRLRAEGPLPLPYVADCVVQACEALAHAHATAIVHRDIKPSNLFEHRDAEDAPPVLKVLDFGISKSRQRDATELTLTSSHEAGVLGSPLYMSPEQVRDPRNVDARTDLWALGAVAYRLLSGRHPFDGDTVGAVFAAILERPLSPLRELGIDVPPEVDALIARCLERDRRLRIPDAGALAEGFAPFASERVRPIAERARQISARALNARPIVGDEPHTMTLLPPSSQTRSTRPTRPTIQDLADAARAAGKRGRWWIGLGVFGLAAGAGLAAAMIGARGAARPASTETTALDPKPPIAVQAGSREPIPIAPAPMPDGPAAQVSARSSPSGPPLVKPNPRAPSASAHPAPAPAPPTSAATSAPPAIAAPELRSVPAVSASAAPKRELQPNPYARALAPPPAP